MGRYNCPSKSAIKISVDKFESTGLVHNIPITARVRQGRSAEHIAAVSKSVEEDPDLSIPRRSHQNRAYWV